MPYYTGSVNNYTDLVSTIFTNCVANGWTDNNPVLSKGTSFLSLTVNPVESGTSILGEGIIMQAGTGRSGSSLTGACTAKPRFGPPHKVVEPPVWPMTYHMFIFENPDEVYVVANFNLEFYYWLAFGKSSVSLPGTGFWCSAISIPRDGPSNPTTPPISLTETIAGAATLTSACPFWNSSNYSGGAWQNSIAHVSLAGVTWANDTSTGAVNGAGTLGQTSCLPTFGQRLSRQPNSWNGQAVFLRIQPIMMQTEFKGSIIADFKNARIMRIDNYTPGDIITLGLDKWKVFPFYRKDSTNRNAGPNVFHTGTYGWAIRYEGP